jgi:deoxyadenosine/deoxycytidine kinase
MQIETIKLLKKIIITGSVAVGKSSIVNYVKQELESKNYNVILVPEYIDYLSDGVTMLNKYFKSIITPYEFQLYILNYYETYLNNLANQTNEISKNSIILFERCIDDGITCFSNLDNKKGKLSNTELNDLLERALKINQKYNLPTYFKNTNQTFIPIKTEDIELDSLLISSVIQLRSKYPNIIIGLYNSPEICYERLQERNREGESKFYDYEYIKTLSKHYKRLYKSLMHSRYPLSLTTIGSLM